MLFLDKFLTGIAETKIWHGHEVCSTVAMELIVFESEAFKKIRQELLEEQRIFLTAWAASLTGQNSEKTVWLSPEDARNRLHVKSRKKMKQIRSSGEVHYLKSGREFLYDQASLESYMLKQSTKKYSVPIPQKTKTKLK